MGKCGIYAINMEQRSSVIDLSTIDKHVREYANEQTKSYARDERNAHSVFTVSSCPAHLSMEDLPDEAQPDKCLTNKELEVYENWRREKLFALITDRLARYAYKQSGVPKGVHSEPGMHGVRLYSIVQSGFYSKDVLTELLKRGMTSYDIVKIMKLGLVSLNHCECSYLKHFGVDPYVLQFEDKWEEKLDKRLITNLRAIGLPERKCWHIVVFGIISQTAGTLYRLMLSGVDIPRLLNWKITSTYFASPKTIEFVRHIGFGEIIVKWIKKHGLDDEIRELLADMGHGEVEEKEESGQEIICGCSPRSSESNTNNTEETQIICAGRNSNNWCTTSSSVNTSDYLQRYACKCMHSEIVKPTIAELTARRNDYLRQNVMVPLSWAMGRALRYGPTDPKYYTACQLLRWGYGNVSQMEKDNAQEFVALATVALDRKFTARKILEKEEEEEEEEENMMKMKKSVLKNIPCKLCKDRRQEQCWKCTKRPARKLETCEFQRMCSFCKIDLSYKKDNSFLTWSHSENGYE